MVKRVENFQYEEEEEYDRKMYSFHRHIISLLKLITFTKKLITEVI